MQNKKLLAAALVALIPISAQAGVYTAAVSGAPGATVTLNVTFAGDGATTETQTDLDFSNANITITNPVPSNGGLCLVVNPTKLRVVPPSGGNTPLTSTATTYCSYSVAIAGGTADGLIPFTASGIECTNAMAGSEACTLAAGAGVTVANTPVPRTLSYNPAVGSTITFAAGATPGSAAPDQNIAVTATGTSGSATVSGCAITGAGASSFNVAPTSLTFNASNTQNLVVGCDYPTSNATATLTCTETDGDTVAPGAARAFTLSCPAPAVNPTIASAPASGSTVNVSGGIAGTQGIGLVDFSASGGSGAGSTAISCTSTGNVQIANAPATPSGQGPVNQTVIGTNAPVDLRIGVQLTTNAQSPAGTVTCTAAGQADFTFNVNAPAGTTVVPPTFIPSSSTWSTIALLSLLGVFGLLAVGFRRQS